jgi:hypothetical protein
MLPPNPFRVLIANEQYGITRYEPHQIRLQTCIKSMNSILVLDMPKNIQKRKLFLELEPVMLMFVIMQDRTYDHQRVRSAG